jgi:bifunctional non-homologous end joining protein LigD
VPGDQLPLSIAGDVGRRLPARIVPMQPTPGEAPFDDPDYLFEPWWPGVRAIALVEGGRLRLQAQGLADALDAVPELAGLASQVLGDGVVLDGMLLVLDAAGRPDAALLRRRLASAAGRGRPGRAAFVASDLLWAGSVPLTRRPFRVRRQRLEEVVVAGDRLAVAHAYPTDGTLVAEALLELGVEQMSARKLAARYRSGTAGEAWLRLPVGGPPLREVPRRPALTLIQKLPFER